MKTTTRKLTYLGRKASVTTTYHGGSATGLRTIETTWIDQADEANGGYPAGTVTTETVRGDGRKPNFEVVSPVTVKA